MLLLSLIYTAICKMMDSYTNNYQQRVERFIASENPKNTGDIDRLLREFHSRQGSIWY